MTKEDLLKHIAETAYNVGFGAKKHFATYDIADKTPGFISFISMAFGIYALAIDDLSTKFLSASFIILGIIGLYISLYDSQKGSYQQAGSELTKKYNELSKLYKNVKSSDENQIPQYEKELSEIEDKYCSNCNSKQILFSDWYAHYKFFWQHQIDWVDEQKHFTFLKDKVPLSFSMSVIGVLLGLIIWRCNILSQICSLVAP